MRRIGGLYGHRNIDDTLLQKWILEWDETKVIDYIRSMEMEVDRELERYLIQTVRSVKQVTSENWSGRKGFFYDFIQRYLSDIMVYTYFCSSSSTISVANYHEVLLEPSDAFTKKSLIEGYKYVQRGGIDIYHRDKPIGHIGEMSTLFWDAFYKQYSVNDGGSIESARNSDNDFTLQIWDSKLVSTLHDLDEIVEKVIYNCSINLGLNFRRTVFDRLATNKGNAKNFSLNLKNSSIEITPMYYYNFANYTPISRQKYIAYYQVIEFFYIRAMKEVQSSDTKELDIIKYIITKAIDKDLIKQWLNRSNERLSYFTEANESYPSIRPIDLNDDTLITLVNRIYSVRCSLIHSKEAPGNFNFIPNLNDDIIENEVPLIKFVAMKVLETWSFRL